MMMPAALLPLAARFARDSFLLARKRFGFVTGLLTLDGLVKFSFKLFILLFIQFAYHVFSAVDVEEHRGRMVLVAITPQPLPEVAKGRLLKSDQFLIAICQGPICLPRR